MVVGGADRDVDIVDVMDIEHMFPIRAQPVNHHPARGRSEGPGLIRAFVHNHPGVAVDKGTS